MEEAQHDGLAAGDVVVIGVDPHNASVTIEARDTREALRATGAFPTTRAGHAAMVRVARQVAAAGVGGRGRPWCVGRALVARLLASGERVVDVPAKLSARSRVFHTGQGRKTDSHDAHTIVMVALRDKRLREVVIDEDLEVLRLLVDRREELAAARTQALNRAHRAGQGTDRGDQGRRGQRRRRRAREGTAGRLFNPARPACPRTPALRISHFPDPRPPR